MWGWLITKDHVSYILGEYVESMMCVSASSYPANQCGRKQEMPRGNSKCYATAVKTKTKHTKNTDSSLVLPSLLLSLAQ